MKIKTVSNAHKTVQEEEKHKKHKLHISNKKDSIFCAHENVSKVVLYVFCFLQVLYA